MKILICPHNWLKKAGGEILLQRLCKHLIGFGHEIKGICKTDEIFIEDGIEFHPEGYMQNIFIKNNELFQWADIVFTQLIGTNYSYNKCRQHDKPNLFFAHNFGKHYFLTDKTKVVYNSNYMQSLRLFEAESIALQPLINYRDYMPSLIEKRRYIALINCNDNKGVNEFIELADMLPQYEFLGIKGNYGQQITTEKSNIIWIENGIIDWSEIKILLIPSEIESWSQVATEAICNGIPVICSDLPGLKENLSSAGIFLNKNELSLYEHNINALMQSDDLYIYQSEKCYKRAKELDPLPRVEVFNKWLINQA